MIILFLFVHFCFTFLKIKVINYQNNLRKYSHKKWLIKISAQMNDYQLYLYMAKS